MINLIGSQVMRIAGFVFLVMFFLTTEEQAFATAEPLHQFLSAGLLLICCLICFLTEKKLYELYLMADLPEPDDIGWK